jgi:two-component system LytT family response regulator
VVPTELSDLVIPVSEIDWIGADDYYARLHVGSKSYLLRESLNSLEKKLDPVRFARIHRSAIIQLDRVRAVRTTAQGDEAIMRDGSFIPVSRRRRTPLVELLRHSGASG